MFARRARISLLRLLCWLPVAMFAPVVFSMPAFAASSTAHAITITSETDTVHFPQSIDFQMSAQDSNAIINKAIIYIQYGPDSIGTSAQHVVSITPGHTISATWVEKTTGDNFVPPGTPVSYSWVLSDSAGYSFTGSQQQFHTVDTRFPWQHLSSGMLQVNWYNRSLDFGQAVLRQASGDITRIGHTLGGGLKHSINLWVYQTDEDFHGSLSPNTYEWVGGIAMPSLFEAEIVVMDSGDMTLVRDMPHELTHLVFHQLIGNGESVPTWFDEGLAVYNQQYHEPTMNSTLQDALKTHSLLPLNSISLSFPANGDQAYLAYAESWNLINYMYSTFGQPKMAKLIQEMSNPSNDFDTDLKLSIGMDQDHLENQWHLYLRQPPTLPPDELTPTLQPTAPPHPVQVTINDTSTPLLIFAGVLLILIPLLAIAFIFIYQRRSRQKALAVQAAGQIIMANRQQASPSSSWPTSLPAQPPSGPPQQPPFGPPYMPPQQWPDYPEFRGNANNSNGYMNGNGNSYNGQAPIQQSPYVPGQEYQGQQPRRQAPQE